MYVNGKQNLGYLVKNGPLHSWPPEVRMMLAPGSAVRMDVQPLTEQESDQVPILLNIIFTHKHV
jgi:IS4 transposase